MDTSRRTNRLVAVIAILSGALGTILVVASLSPAVTSDSLEPLQGSLVSTLPAPTPTDSAIPETAVPSTRGEATPAYPGFYLTTPTPDPTPVEGANQPRSNEYVVQQGDTLSSIAYAFGCTVEEIAAGNGVDGSAIWPGQRLTIPVGATEFGPDLKLLPDSELVYSPAYIHFDLEGFVQESGGYLARYSEQVEGRERTGAQIVQMVSQRYSVGPRVLLALLEVMSSWVTSTDPAPESLYHPLSLYDGYRSGLFEQLSGAAAELNGGYYGWKYGGRGTVRLADGIRLAVSPGLNAGTVALHSYFGKVAYGERWWSMVGPDGFAATYQSLFGNPFSFSVDPLLPPDLTQPEFKLPWEEGRMWYLTAGPHAGWDRGSGWAALDFVPSDEDACTISAEWATAAAAGLVLRSDYGEVVVDLDGDGYEQSGWVLTYLHMSRIDRVAVGTWLQRGQRIGHPSCEGGAADATHLHFARRYNGEWIPAGSGSVPLVLSEWTAHEATREYDGTMTSGDQTREACQCSDDSLNGIVSDNTPPE
jgi:LysM repeat protein